MLNIQMPYHFLSVCIKFLSNFPIELTAQHIKKVIDSMKNAEEKGGGWL